jgi:hypothetical protein
MISQFFGVIGFSALVAIFVVAAASNIIGWILPNRSLFREHAADTLTLRVITVLAIIMVVAFVVCAISAI